MKGRTPTAAETRHMQRVRRLGCIACRNAGVYTPEEYTCVHHVEGKTRPGAHFKTLPLCDAHHSRYSSEGLHYNKAAWQAIHGSEAVLLEQVALLLSIEK